MSLQARNLDSFFSSESPLSAALAGFSHRPEQLEMAQLVAGAMASGRHLAVEAGAGTGKTLAYLVPALLSRRRVIVATATKTLQDQLYHRDLPVVASALGRPAGVAQLKGRANYLCSYRLDQALALPEQVERRLLPELRRVSTWAMRTASGDIGEISGVAEASGIWPLVTSTADNCLGGRCPSIERCHVVAARRRAADADVAIVNHHLLLADMVLKDDGFGRLLPGAETVIVDEAHRFPETAQAQFDVSFGARQIEELLRDAARELRTAGPVPTEFQGCIDELTAAIRDASAAMPRDQEPLAMTSAPPAVAGSLRTIAEELECFSGVLGGCADSSVGLARCAERATTLAAAAGRIADWEAASDLCWIQSARKGFIAHMTPVDASSQLRELIGAQLCTWILTSATLAVGEDFAHFSRQLGLDPLDTHRIDSPFDYQTCARLFLPHGMPLPDAADFTDRMIEAIEPVLETSRGRAFLLFTSRRALERAAELLAQRSHGHTVLVQGTASRSRLLDDFAGSPNAVLLGTATFWEGVDIRGPGLVVVAIDRLPFASPGDPLLQARLELVRRNGGDPFRDYQLPRAVLALRQGVGRLVRGYDDYGVVVICDPRLTARGYGRVFLSSLPPMPIVRTASDACDFLRAKEGEG